MRYLYTLLVLIPVALVLDRLHAPAAWVFGASALAILPLSAVMGRATEALAERTGPTVGGLLNATMGNAAELIITVFALQAGLIDLVKASLTGSILGNLLLILGLSIFVGGLRHPVQTFSARAAGMSVAHMMLAIIALGFPALFALTHPERAARVQQIELSLAVAGVLILVYGAGLVFTLVTHRSLVAPPVGEAGAAGEQHWGARRALVLLVLSTVGVAFMSELLVHATEEAIASLGLTELFVGVIVIPLIGNAAEHTAAVWMAAKNKMDLAFGIAIGSSTQIALFVAPVLVFIALAIGRPMDFVFTGLEVASIAVASGIVAVISFDGESHWLEGIQLLAVYAIVGVTFFFY